eukprot:1392253-Rhodomonas_salina.5
MSMQVPTTGASCSEKSNTKRDTTFLVKSYRNTVVLFLSFLFLFFSFLFFSPALGAPTRSLARGLKRGMGVLTLGIAGY